MISANSIISILFAISAIASALAIYLSENVFKSAIALAATFTIVSLVLLLLNQPVVAVLQLLIIVGGLSTYLVVAVASESKKYTWPTDLRLLAATAIILFISLMYLMLPSLSSTSVSNQSIYAEFLQTLQAYTVTIYFAIVLMFAAAIGSMIVIKSALNKNPM